jgi:hypothetical protein
MAKSLEELERMATAQNEMAHAEHLRRLGKINEQAAASYGSQAWNEDVAVFNKISKGRETEFTQLLTAEVIEDPKQVVRHIASNEGNYEGLGQLSARQVLREFVKIDTAGEPQGRVKPQAVPRYLASGNESSSSPEQFLRDGGVHEQDEAKWHRDFDKAQKFKNRTVPR